MTPKTGIKDTIAYVAESRTVVISTDCSHAPKGRCHHAESLSDELELNGRDPLMVIEMVEMPTESKMILDCEHRTQGNRANFVTM